MKLVTIVGARPQFIRAAVVSRAIKEKFEIVIEGHQSLRHDIKDLRQDMNERFELVDFKIETLNKKIDNVDEKLSKKIDGVQDKLDARSTE
jgi:UDP-N-acetylglucosamine 2-epimerase